MKNFIFFRTDRLGDFIITTSIIKAIKKKVFFFLISTVSNNVLNVTIRFIALTKLKIIKQAC